MTLMELMAALAILGLLSATAFSSLGPWLAMSRTAAREAELVRASMAAQLVLAELAAGAVDPHTRAIAAHEARFTTLAPRLSPAPVAARLAILRDGDGSRLVFSAPGLGPESVLLETEAPLRFAPGGGDALVIEIERGGRWTGLLAAHFAADAPLVCAFDPIARTCR